MVTSKPPIDFFNVLISFLLCVPDIQAYHNNLLISQPSVVSISGYRDPLHIGNAQLRESRHNGVIAFNINPGYYQVSSPMGKDSKIPHIRVEPGIGIFYSNTNLRYPIWVEGNHWVSLGNTSIEVPISGYYSCLATYRLLQHPSIIDIPISLEKQLLIHLRLDQQTISSQYGARGSFYRQDVFLESGTHYLQLRGKLATTSCHPRIKHQFCEPIRFALLPSVGNGFESLVYLGIWKITTNTTSSLTRQNSLVKNVQNHLHYLLSDRMSPNLDIDLL